MSRKHTACATNYTSTDPTVNMFVVLEGEQKRIWIGGLTQDDVVVINRLYFGEGKALSNDGCGFTCAEPGEIVLRTPYTIDCRQVRICSAGGSVIWIDQPGSYELVGTGPSFENGTFSFQITPFKDVVVTDDMRYLECCEAVATADVSIEKTQSSDNPTVGAPFFYGLLVSNNGPDTAFNVSVIESFPPNFSSTSVSVAYSGGATGPAIVTFNQLVNGVVIDSLPVGGEVNFTINGTFTYALSTAVNTAGIFLLSSVFDPDLNNNSATVTANVVSVSKQANVVIEKEQSSNNVVVGAPFSYTITATNNGPDGADGTLVYDNLPINFVVNSITISYSGGASGPPAVTEAQLAAGVAIPVFPSGAIVTYSIAGFFSAAGNGYVNTAWVSLPSEIDDPTPGNNIDSTPPVTVSPLNPSVTINKTVNTVNALVGGPGIYNIEVENVGVIPADGAIVYDLIPSNFTVGSITIAYFGGAAGPMATTSAQLSAGFVVPLLPIGGSLIITVSGTFNAAGTVDNMATVVTPAGSVVSIAPSVTVTGSADLGVTKTASAIAVLVGQPITFTGVVTNAGPSPADGSILTDNFPPTFIPSSITLTYLGGASGPATVTAAELMAGVVIPTLPAGGGVSVTVNIAGVFSDVNVSQTNTMTITPPPGTIDPSNSNNSSTTDSIAITLPVADIDVVKTVSNTAVDTLEPLTFIATITNNGPDTAGAPTIQDVLTNFTATSISLTYSGGASGPATLTQPALAAGALVSPMPSGSQIIVTITGSYSVVGSYVNTLTCFPDIFTNDPNLLNNAGSSPIVTVSSPGMLCPNPAVTATVSPTSFTNGVAYVGTISVDDATSIDSVTGLPNGISYVAVPLGSGFTINLSGVPFGNSGSYAVKVNATNACGFGTTTFGLNMNAGIMSVLLACPPTTVFWGNQSNFFNKNFVVGVPFSHAVDVNNSVPLVPANIVGLPAGITVTFIDNIGPPRTVFFGGTPTTPGPYSITVNTTNSGPGGCVSSGPVVGLLVRDGVIPTDCAVPSVVVPLSPDTVPVSAPFNVTLFMQVLNTTSASISGFPPGFSVFTNSNDGIVEIVGVPSSVGVYPVTITLTNNCTSGPDQTLVVNDTFTIT